jgi:hypothetical protein
MSLEQKYTWYDFLKEHPELREKKIKRTSADGKKAFAAASKAFAKKYLAERAERLTRDIARATKLRDEYVVKLRELRKGKKHVKAKLVQERVGRADHAIAQIGKLQEKTKERQKTL